MKCAIGENLSLPLRVNPNCIWLRGLDISPNVRFRKLTGRQTIATANDNLKSLKRYRVAHPESLEKERKQIQRWLTYVESRSERQSNNEREQERKTNEALSQLREVARLAFMIHPAATQ